MNLGLAYWIVLFLWLLLGAAPIFKSGERSWSGIGGALFPFVAAVLIGWAVFGPPLHR